MLQGIIGETSTRLFLSAFSTKQMSMCEVIARQSSLDTVIHRLSDICSTISQTENCESSPFLPGECVFSIPKYAKGITIDFKTVSQGGGQRGTKNCPRVCRAGCSLLLVIFFSFIASISGFLYGAGAETLIFVTGALGKICPRARKQKQWCTPRKTNKNACLGILCWDTNLGGGYQNCGLGNQRRENRSERSSALFFESSGWSQGQVCTITRPFISLSFTTRVRRENLCRTPSTTLDSQWFQAEILKKTVDMYCYFIRSFLGEPV